MEPAINAFRAVLHLSREAHDILGEAHAVSLADRTRDKTIRGGSLLALADLDPGDDRTSVRARVPAK